MILDLLLVLFGGGLWEGVQRWRAWTAPPALPKTQHLEVVSWAEPDADAVADRVVCGHDGRIQWQVHTANAFEPVMVLHGDQYSYRGQLADGRWLYVAR